MFIEEDDLKLCPICGYIIRNWRHQHLDLGDIWESLDELFEGEYQEVEGTTFDIL